MKKIDIYLSAILLAACGALASCSSEAEDLFEVTQEDNAGFKATAILPNEVGTRVSIIDNAQSEEEFSSVGMSMYWSEDDYFEARNVETGETYRFYCTDPEQGTFATIESIPDGTILSAFYSKNLNYYWEEDVQQYHMSGVSGGYGGYANDTHPAADLATLKCSRAIVENGTCTFAFEHDVAYIRVAIDSQFYTDQYNQIDLSIFSQDYQGKTYYIRQECYTSGVYYIAVCTDSPGIEISAMLRKQDDNTYDAFLFMTDLQLEKGKVYWVKPSQSSTSWKKRNSVHIEAESSVYDDSGNAVADVYLQDNVLSLVDGKPKDAYYNNRYDVCIAPDAAGEYIIFSGILGIDNGDRYLYYPSYQRIQDNYNPYNDYNKLFFAGVGNEQTSDLHLQLMTSYVHLNISTNDLPNNSPDFSVMPFVMSNNGEGIAGRFDMQTVSGSIQISGAQESKIYSDMYLGECSAVFGLLPVSLSEGLSYGYFYNDDEGYGHEVILGSTESMAFQSGIVYDLPIQTKIDKIVSRYGDPLMPGATLSSSFSYKVRTEMFGETYDPDNGIYDIIDENVTKIVFDYNSSVNTGFVISEEMSTSPIYANYLDGVLTVSTSEPTIKLSEYSGSLFCNFRNLRSIEGLENIDSSNCLYLGNLFSGCESLESLDLSSFDTRNCIEIYSMFHSCKSLADLRLGENFLFNSVGVEYDQLLFVDIYDIDIERTINITCTAQTRDYLLNHEYALNSDELTVVWTIIE